MIEFRTHYGFFGIGIIIFLDVEMVVHIGFWSIIIRFKDGK